MIPSPSWTTAAEFPSICTPPKSAPRPKSCLTVLHAGGKFDSDTYKVSGGLHGVGVSVVNALADWLELEISRDGAVWEQTYEKGKPTSKLKQTGKTRKTGTKITFHPDPTIFDKTTYSFDTLAQRLRELAFLNKGLKITLTDERSDKTAEFKFTGGISEFVKHLNRGKTTLHDSPIYIEGKRGNVEIEIALQYNDSYGENVFAFANAINTVDGGTHLSGFPLVADAHHQQLRFVRRHVERSERRSDDQRRRRARRIGRCRQRSPAAASV